MNAAPRQSLRLCVALPGFHRVNRGAEAALEAVARELASRHGFAVTLLGGGPERAGEPYAYRSLPLRPREAFEHWPRVPPFRNEYRWEEGSFVRPLLRAFQPADYDLTLTCSYPFVNWALRLRRRGGRPRHVFVTQNGDWPARRLNAEYRFFSCDGLVCTNPEFHDRHAARWRCALIPNGLDPARLRPGPADCAALGLPADRPVVLMVAALIPSKRVLEAVRIVARQPDAHLLVVGDGPLRAEFDELAGRLLPGRWQRRTAGLDEMPGLYRAADVFLHMSREESFGNVYIEAMACGLPVVAHDYATTRWIFAEAAEHARLVDTDDEAAVSAALAEAWAAPRDRAAARHELIARRFGWPGIGDRYAEFLREVART